MFHDPKLYLDGGGKYAVSGGGLPLRSYDDYLRAEMDLRERKNAGITL